MEEVREKPSKIGSSLALARLENKADTVSVLSGLTANRLPKADNSGHQTTGHAIEARQADENQDRERDAAAFGDSIRAT